MKTKLCSKCNRELPLDSFYKHKRHKDGLDSMCKDCVKERSRQYREEHKEDCQEYDKLRQSTDARKKQHKDAAQRYWEKNPDRKRAHNAVGKAIQRGKLIRPNQCEKCGKECKPYAHHWLGYDKEHWLDIQWLCNACHREEHK